MHPCLFTKTETSDNSFQRHWKCLRCGYVSTSEEKPVRVCKKLPLGDKVEWFLTQIGLSKERFRWIKNMVFNIFRQKRKPLDQEGCLCEFRQEWLNKLDDRWLLS